MHTKSLMNRFSSKYRLRVTTDKGDGTAILNGRHGHIYGYSDDRLGVIFLGDSVGKANNRRKACEIAGMEIKQNGDCEFAAAFDPADGKQAAPAIKVAGCKAKRILSEAQKSVLENLKAHRFGSRTGENGPLAA